MDRQIALTEETVEELRFLSHQLGYSKEMAVHYAVRLVAACIREGLLSEETEALWPEEAQSGLAALRCTGTMGKVIPFRRA